MPNKILSIFTFIGLIALFACDSNGLTDNDSKTNALAVPTDSLRIPAFPADWLGYWEGTLQIFGNEGLKQSLPMALEMAETDDPKRFVWAIIYGEDTIAGRRSYYLEEIDASKGLYLLDEDNSIKMEAYVFANKIYNNFHVMGNDITCSYELRGDEIYFDITSGKAEKISSSGNQVVEGEEIPEVLAFPINVRQFATLKRKK